MERLTKLNKKLYNNSPISQEYPTEYVTKNNKLAINKLAEYENTGLEPSEVEQLKANQNKVVIEKLEELLKFIYGNKWTNIELCVDNSPLKIIRNKLDTMISGLKGDK